MSEYQSPGIFHAFLRMIEKCFSSRYRFLTLFFVALLVRVASFFVDYYYPDMIVSVLYRNGLNGGWHLIPHKGIVYTAFLDFTFALFGMSSKSLHIMALFLTYLEGLGVYALARNIKFSKKIAYAAAMIFILVSSTALPEIMVPNGEQLFMLFFLWGFVCFVKAYYDRQYWYITGVIIFLLLSVGSKQTGIWFPLTIAFCWYLDILKHFVKSRRAFILGIVCAWFMGLVIGISLLICANHHPHVASLHWLSNAWDYIRSYPKFNIMKWVAVLFLVFCHPFLFFFPVGQLIAQWKHNDFTRREIFLYGVTFALFLSAFAGGTRLYEHYFFPLYPILSIFCATFIYRYGEFGKLLIKKAGGLSIIHMGILFGLYIYWALLVHPLRSWYFKYPEFTPNSYSIFLYPNKMERETIAFLQKEKKNNPHLQIYIWPIGHVMAYFSKLPFKIGPYIDVSDNRCILYKTIKECAKERVDSFFQLNQTGDIFVEYRGILDPNTFSSNPIKAFIQRGISSHQGLFGKTELFAQAIDEEMLRRKAHKIFAVRNSLYLWQKP